MIFSSLDVFFANSSFLAVNGKIVCIQIQKTWSQSCYSFHCVRLSHCPDCRNEQRWKPHVCAYIVPTIGFLAKMPRWTMEGMDIIHSMRRFRCFVFDLQLKLRSSHASKPKRKIRLCYYVCVRPPLYPLGLSARLRLVAKVMQLFKTTKHFPENMHLGNMQAGQWPVTRPFYVDLLSILW